MPGHTGTTRSQQIDSLTNSTSYDVRVRGVNAAGATAYGADVRERDPDCGAHAGRPASPCLRAMRRSTSSGSEPTGSPTSYTVEYKLRSASTWTDAGHTGTTRAQEID